jgi:hypothetical protein
MMQKSAPLIQIRDQQDLLGFDFDDLIKYHGRFNIGGVAMAFRVLAEGFARLSPTEPPERSQIAFKSGLGEKGTGVIDAVEMVTRAKTHGRLTLEQTWLAGKPGPATPDGRGKYYFELTVDDKQLGFELRSGLIPAEFIELTRKLHAQTITESELQRLRQIKEHLAPAILAAPFADLFHIHMID